MKKAFVKNSNYDALMIGVKSVEQRGAREASFLLVTGPAGLGKSAAVDKFAVESNAVHLRAKATWTKRALLDEAAESLRVSKVGRNQEVQARLISAIGAKQIPIILDEAEFTVGSTAAMLECVRDISDITETIVVLVGMEQIEMKIARYPQIASRIAHVVTFRPATIEDVSQAVKQLSEVDFADDLIAELHRQSEGKMRLIINGIATLERFGKANGRAQVTLADINNRAICYEWQARKPRSARAS